MAASPSGRPDLAAIKSRQQKTWSSGDYAAVGALILPVSENLCDSADLQAGWARALGPLGHRIAAFVEVDGRKIGQRIQGAPVLPVHEAGLRGPLHLGAVGQKGARARIREAVARLGLQEGRDFVAVA